MSEPSLGDILAQAQQMQQQLIAAQAEAAASVVEGSAGGGAVKITVNGHLEFKSVQINSEVVDPDDVAMLEDLVLAALGDAMAQIAEMQQSAMGGLDMGALGNLGGLGGMLGQG